MLFPQLSPEYYNEKDRGILARMESAYAESITINQSFWSEADTDNRFYVGDQTLWNDLYGNLPANRRRQFNFNRIKRVVSMISGHQRRNRKSSIVIPIENSDQQTADQFTKIFLWLDQQESVLETISDAFEGALITGMNLLQVWVDYRTDPVNGNIKVDNCHYNSFLIDPFFRKADLSDCNYLWKRTYVTKREAMSLIPDHAEEISGLYGNSYSGSRDNKFQFMVESYNYGRSNLLTYDEYYYRGYRTGRFLIDSQTGETQEWHGKDEDALREFLRLYPTITVVDQEIPTVNLAIIVQGKVMYDGRNPMGLDRYPFAPVWAYYSPQIPYYPWRVMGVIRNLRDAQYLYNRRSIIMLDALESQINSGWIYKENALVNPKDIFMAGQGKGIALKEEAQMTDVQQIQSPGVHPSQIELAKLMGDEMNQISGVSEELLGAATDDKAGILSMLRQGAGLTTLQGLFDQLDRSQKILGKIFLDIIQAQFTPGKVQRIVGEKPTDQFYNKAFGRYDCSVEDGINTTTQKQMQFAQMLHLKEVGIQIPDDVILDATTMQNKNKLLERIQQAAQQQQQMQMQQMQVQMQESQARTELAKARAMADQGLGMERVSRIEENRALAVERNAKAQADHEQAILNMVKAMKELETIDINHIEKLISLSNLLKAQEAAQTQALQPQNENQSSSVAKAMEDRQQINQTQTPNQGGPVLGS